MKIEGRAWKVGDHVDTDLIIPARFLNISDKIEFAKYCFADLKPDFVEGVKPGDILVAGVNFGCGSSREHAPWALKQAGIGAVIAKSFARIFYRNAFNIGLPILESKEAPDQIEEGDVLAVNFSTGEMVNENNRKRFQARPVPAFMRSIIDAGGLVEHVRKTQGNGVMRKKKQAREKCA
ncbi:MAG: 3-isopropylmalate dehydratase small subunit [Deltaproteobacteria bacterium]|nr:MAG: 3-isopropylmalate dehydratase small subunit [Deltaproteobacteria bacterium]